MTRDAAADAYGIRARSPLARSGLYPERMPRHCSACGRGLSRRTRVILLPDERLLLAIFGVGPQCRDCAPAAMARIAPVR